MRSLSAWLFALMLLSQSSCHWRDPPPPAPGGVSVYAPGVRVNVSDAQGVSVDAPGTRVRATP